MPKPIEFITEDEDGNENVIQLPSMFEICARCRGEGRHVNPNIDGNGISPQEFAEDPDFEEAYFRGDYDVPCKECRGDRVVAVIDEDACKSKGLMAELQEYYNQQEQMSRQNYEDAYIRRMESGGY